MTREYKVVKGTAFHPETNDEVVSVINRLLSGRRDIRVRVWFGDTETGEAWPEGYDVTGYIGRSTGTYKIPLLVHNKRSRGGGGLLDHCIVRIDTTSGRTLYKHPDFDPGQWEVEEEFESFATYRNGKLWSRHKSREEAENLVAFMIGKQYRAS